VLFAIGLAGAVALSSGAGMAQVFEVEFPDPNLEQAVRLSIDLPTGPILNTDLVGVGFTSLNASALEIADLTGLEHATDLTQVRLYENDIADISPLAALTQLADVYLWGNEITDVTPLSALPNLRFVFLHDNSIVDATSLGDNLSLGLDDVVNLTGNLLDQRTLCETIPDLESRGVTVYYEGTCGQNIVDIPDANLELKLRRFLNKPPSEGPLFDTDLARLEALDISDSAIADLTGLDYCVNVTALYAGGNQFSDISALAQLTKIYALYLGGNAIRNLTPLTELYGLQYLELQDNEIRNPDGIQHLTGLFTLFLHDNLLSDEDLPLLRNLVNLRVLTLGQNQFTDIAPLNDLRNLLSLDIGSNQVSDLTPLQDLADLARLSAADNQLVSITPLAPLVGLLYLDVSQNQVSDIGVLAELPDLVYIYLENNGITNISSLAGLPLLAVVSLRDNKLSDISALVANTGLGDTPSFLVRDRVDLRGNPLSQEVLCDDIPQLQARNVLVEHDGRCDEHGTTYTLTMAVNNADWGSVDPPEGTRRYTPGTEVTLAATPEVGYVFDHWEGDLSGSDNPTTITMDSDKRIVAVFGDATELFALTVEVDGEGTVEPPVGVHTYPSGVAVAVEATPADEWVFDHWEGDVPDTLTEMNPIEITMDADKTVRAVFVEQGPLRTLTLSVSGQGTVTVDPEAEGNAYPEGTVVSIEAIADLGFVFDHWEGDIPGGAGNPFGVVMDGDKSITAVFVPDGFDHTLAIVAEGGGTTDPAPGLRRYLDGDEVTVRAIPDPGWVFDHWTGDVAGERNPATVRMDRDKTVKAVFQIAEVTFTLTVTEVADGGTIDPPPGEYVFAAGKQVVLLATPAQGWVFDGWEGDLGGDANPAVLTMNGNLTVGAAFAEFPYVTGIFPDKGSMLGGEGVLIAGGRLATATSVLFGDEEGEIVEATEDGLAVLTPPNERGVVDVAVTTPLGTVTVLGAFTFIEPPPPPEIGVVIPDRGRIEGGETVLIRGRYLAVTLLVTFGGLPAEIVNAEETRLTVVTPPNLPGPADVQVVTSTGTDVSEDAFTYLAPPVVLSVVPNEGYVGGGDTVVIAGLALENPDSVTFGGFEAMVTSSDANAIVVESPQYPSSTTVDVMVTTAGGTSILEDAFEYYAEAATIVCYVRDAQTQAPILDATVLLDPVGRLLQGSVDGAYRFVNIRPGDYVVGVAVGEDYIPQTRDVTALLGQQLALTFLMQKIPEIPNVPCAFLLGRLDVKVAEETMPLSIQESLLASVSPDSVLSIRLTADDPIDPESVWAVAEADEWFATGGAWRPTAPDDDRDGWVRFATDEPLPAGDTVTLTVGAVTTEGAVVGPVTKDFSVSLAKADEDGEPSLAEATDVTSLPSVLAAGRSPVYRIAPAGVFEEPVTVQIPVPDGVEAGSLDLYYYSEALGHLGWYPAANVVGWLAPDSRQVVDSDGQTYVEIQVNHSGVLQLGKAIQFDLGSAGPVEVGVGGSRTGWISLVSTLLALSLGLGLLVRRGERA